MNEIQQTIRASRRKRVLSNQFWNYYMIAFALITAAQEIFSIAPLVYVGLSMTVIGLVVADAENMRSLFVFFILFNSENSLYTVNVVFSVMFLYKTYKEIKITYSIKCIALLIVWEFLHVLTYSFFKYDLKYFIQQSGFALVMFANIVMVIQTDVKKEYTRMMHIFVYATTASCAIFYINYVQYFGIQYALSFSAGIGRLSNGLNSFKKNPNMVSRCVSFACALFLVQMLLSWRQIDRKQKITYIFTMLALIFFGMTTGSMSFYMAVAICVGWMFVGVLHDFPAGRAITLIYSIVMMIVSAVSAIVVLMPAAVRRIIHDLFQEDVSNGRTTLWSIYTDLFLGNGFILLVGVGLQDYFRKISVYMGEEVDAAHNIMFEMVLSWGLFGTVLMGLLILIMYMETKLVVKNRCLIAWMPVLTIVFISQTGNFFYGYYTNMVFIVLTVLGFNHTNWYYEQNF